MKKLFQISLLLWLAANANANAQENAPEQPTKVLRAFNWSDLPSPSTNCQIVSMDGMSVLKIENTNDAPLEISVWRITNSSAIQKTYFVSFEMKYENVRSKIIEHTNQFGAPSYLAEELGLLRFLQYFPPTFSDQNEDTNHSDEYISGTSIWKPHYFWISRENKVGLPIQLELRFSLPKTGIVYLRPIKLLSYASSSNWWTPEQGGMIGGIGGAVIGCVGALVGVLASRGKARKLVLALTKIFIVLGIFLLLAGAIAAAMKQPYAVYYPLLLAGFILTIVFSVNLPSIQRRYDELEIRRMTSVDTMGS
jgi:hypothetical protein